MSGDYTVLSQSQVRVRISSSATSFTSEKTFPKGITVNELKGKLELMTGCSCTSMRLEVYDKEDKLVCLVEDGSAPLGSYPIDDDMRIHVIDHTKTLGEYEDVSKVQKYEMSAEQYENRTDSVRAFKQRMKLGRFADMDPEEQKQREEAAKQKEEKEKELAAALKTGDRCQISVPTAPLRRGEVKYVGETEFKAGIWVGIQYDEPVGKNDGSVQGKRYFECPPKYGGFVRPENVEVGDFPEEGFSDDDLDEI